MHAFQGRTVDNVIAAMEATHPHLTTQKSFYVEISRARDRAELVTDDAKALKEQLEAHTGERISALEGIGETKLRDRDKAMDTLQVGYATLQRGIDPVEREASTSPDNDRGIHTVEHGRTWDMGPSL